MNDADDTEISLAELFHLVRRRWRALAAGAFVGVAGAAAVTLFMHPVYVAEASVLVGKPAGQLGLAGLVQDLPAGLGSLVGGTTPTAAEMQVIRSRPVVESVVLPRGVSPIAPEAGRDLLVRVEDLDRSRVWHELRERFLGAGPAGRLEVDVERWDFPAGFSDPLLLEFRGDLSVEISIDRWSDREARVLRFQPGEPLEYLGATLRLRPEGSLEGRRFHVGYRSARRAVEDFQRALRVEERQRGSAVVRISYPDSDPERAAEIVNALVESYRSHNRERLRLEALTSNEYVEGELERVREELDAAERELVAFGERAGTVALPETAAVLVEKLAEADFERAQSQFRARSTRDLLGRLGSGEITAEDLVGIEATHGELPARLDPLSALLEEKRVLEATYTEEWPALREANVKIEQRMTSMREVLESELWAEEQLGLRLDGIVQGLQHELEGLPQVQVELIRHTRRVEAFSQIYLFLVGKREDARIQQSAAVPSVEVIEPAVPPLRRSAPKIRVQLGIGLGVGLLLGLALAFVRDRRRPLTRVEQLERLAGAPRLATLPRGRGRSGDDLDPREEEAYRVLCAAVQHRVEDGGPRVLAVASASRGEGRTRVVRHLGAALARTGARVLLVDADLARPSLSRALGADGAAGLTELAGRGEARPRAVAGAAGLELLAAGTDAGAADRLGAARDALARVAAGYDHVLVDAPALLDGGGAAAVLRAVPDVLWVARAESTDEATLARALALARQIGATVRGVVLNASRGSSG